MVNPIIFPFYTNIYTYIYIYVSIYIYIYIYPHYISIVSLPNAIRSTKGCISMYSWLYNVILYIYIYIIYPLYPSLWPLHPHDIPILPSHHQIPLCFPTFGPSACASRRAQVKPVQLHRGSSGPKKWGSHNLNGTLKMGLT